MIHKKLSAIQTTLKAPKSQFNKFGGYPYRSCEDILEAVKPHLKEHGCSLIINDEVLMVGTALMVKATATLHFESEQVCATAYAMHPMEQKGMNPSQITGSTSSYARKYALNGLFLIDDTKDADSTNTHGKDEDNISTKISHCKNLAELMHLYSSNKELVDNDEGLKKQFTAKKLTYGTAK
jgi:hypothetical protein